MNILHWVKVLLKDWINIEKNQNSNNNDKRNLTSARSESIKKASINDDELERSVCLPDVAHMKDINIFEPKNETQTSFEYLKNNTELFFFGLSRYF